MQSLRWPLLFGTVLGLLIFSLYAGFAFRGAAAWLVGLIYISYDSALLLFMVGSSQWAVRRQERERPDAPARRPAVTVLICARNERLVLPACLKALRAQTEPAEEILVLDDGSTDAMPAWLEKEFALEFTRKGDHRRKARLNPTRQPELSNAAVFAHTVPVIA